MYDDIFDEHQSVVESLRTDSDLLAHMAQEIWDCLADDGVLYLCGNGGSAADCQHIAAELVCRFKLERGGLPAVALTTDTSILTAVGNDYGYEQVFSRQAQALMCPGDVLLCLSTSGNSQNVVLAARTAREDMGCTVLAMTGKGNSNLSKIAHCTLRVNSRNTARIQEAHILAAHIICEEIDERYRRENHLD